jgi:hypothetical protein
MVSTIRRPAQPCGRFSKTRITEPAEMGIKPSPERVIKGNWIRRLSDDNGTTDRRRRLHLKTDSRTLSPLWIVAVA